MRPRARMLTVLVALVLGLAPEAGARQAGGRVDKPQMSVEFGYTGVIWPERWTPITVHLTCGGSPFDGLLSVTYEQDSTQRAQIVRQIAGTPNKTVAVQVMVNLPPSCRRINIALFDRARGLSGRAVQHLTFAETPFRDELPMPLISATGIQGGPVVIGVGDTRGPAAAVTVVTNRQTGNTAVQNTRVSAAVIAPARLPLVWTGLDGVLLVAVEGEAALGADPRALAAVREWVTAGGRLVIFAPTGAGEWRRWMPGGDAADASRLAVELSSPVEGGVPEELGRALTAPGLIVNAERDQALQQFPETAPPDWTGRPAPPDGARVEPGARPEGGAPKTDELRPEPAARMTYRAIRLTAAGRIAGWNVRWPMAEGSGEGGGLLAEGPVGFGWVTVVGFDPRRVSTVASAAATRAVWTALLQNPLTDWRVASARPDPRKPNYTYSYGFSGAQTGSMAVGPDLAAAGHSSVLEKLSAQVPAATGSFFPVIVGTMIVLALCMGPLDMMLLGRLRLRHRSWATALGWIGLAMLAAYAAPLLSREAVTHVGRLSVVDAIVPREGAGGALDPPALAWRTSLTGVFAGSTTRLEFDGATQGSWWRGTSALAYFDSYPGRRSPSGGALVRMVQQVPDLGALGAANGEIGDPWGGVMVGAPGSGGNRFGDPPSYARLWTFRTFEDQARVSQPLRAAVEPAGLDAEGEPMDGWRVRLKGLPAGANIRAGALRVGTDWFAAEFHEETPGAPASPMTALCTSHQSDGGSFATVLSANATVNYGRYGVPMPEARYKPGLAMALPGPDRRNMAVNSMVGSGKWAALYLDVDGLPPDVRLRGAEGALSTHAAVYRLFVPLTRPAGGPQSPVEEGGPPR